MVLKDNICSQNVGVTSHHLNDLILISDPPDSPAKVCTENKAGVGPPSKGSDIYQAKPTYGNYHFLYSLFSTKLANSYHAKETSCVVVDLMVNSKYQFRVCAENKAVGPPSKVSDIYQAKPPYGNYYPSVLY